MTKKEQTCQKMTRPILGGKRWLESRMHEDEFVLLKKSIAGDLAPLICLIEKKR